MEGKKQMFSRFSFSSPQTRISKLVGAVAAGAIFLLLFVFSVTPTQTRSEQMLLASFSLPTVSFSKTPLDYWLKIQHKDEERAQMTYEQYSALSITLFAYRPVNALIFGVGSDSFIYHWANKGGRTVFLEDSDEWIKLAKKSMHEKENVPLGEIEMYSVNYTTDYMEGIPILRGRNYSRLNEFQYPKNVVDGADGKMSWDFILVDGPLGHEHGRFQSIYHAYRLARRKLQLDRVEKNDRTTVVHVFIHDTERWIEENFGNVFFGNASYYTLLNRRYQNALSEGQMRYYQCNHEWLNAVLENERKGFAFPFLKEW